MFAVNPGPDDSNDSFATFKAAALAVGAQLASSATNATTSQPSKSTGSTSGGLSLISTPYSNGVPVASLIIGGAMLTVAFVILVT